MPFSAKNGCLFLPILEKGLGAFWPTRLNIVAVSNRKSKETGNTNQRPETTFGPYTEMLSNRF